MTLWLWIFFMVKTCNKTNSPWNHGMLNPPTGQNTVLVLSLMDWHQPHLLTLLGQLGIVWQSQGSQGSPKSNCFSSSSPWKLLGYRVPVPPFLGQTVLIHFFSHKSFQFTSAHDLWICQLQLEVATPSVSQESVQLRMDLLDLCAQWLNLNTPKFRRNWNVVPHS